MKASLLFLTLVMALFLLPPTFAQHGHSGGAMGSSGMSHGNASTDHGNPNTGSQSSNESKSFSQLSENKPLASKIQSLTGQDAQTACSGFRNLGQCVAAAHVSNNRKNISFDCLKADVTGQAPPSNVSCPAGTGSKSMSLGKAIQTLDPQANSASEVKKANQQAKGDLKSSS